MKRVFGGARVIKTHAQGKSICSGVECDEYEETDRPGSDREPRICAPIGKRFFVFV